MIIKKLFTIALIWLLFSSGKQVPNEIIGEWTPISSINKKYGTTNCLQKNFPQKWTFSKDGTYRIGGVPALEFYSIGKYNYDNSTMTLKLFGGKNMPANSDLLNSTFKVILLDKTALQLNRCFCIQTEGEEEASDKCITNFKRIK